MNQIITKTSTNPESSIGTMQNIQWHCYLLFNKQLENEVHHIYSLSLGVASAQANISINAITFSGLIKHKQPISPVFSDEIICNFINVSGYYNPPQTTYISDTSSTYVPYVSQVQIQTESLLRDFIDTFECEDSDIDIPYYLTTNLKTLVKENGEPLIEVISKFIDEQEIIGNIANEIIRALGRIDDDNTKNVRFELLLKLLQHKELIIREGAVAGISFFDDRRALPQLNLLLQSEYSPILKDIIRVAISNLESD